MDMKKPFRNSSNKGIVRIDGKEIKVSLANSFLKHAIGLSFKKKLGENEGMLFVFPHPRQPAFWNFITRFPIDVIWISNNSVIGIEKDIPALSRGIKVFKPSTKIDYALEALAGTASRLSLSVGDAIEIIK
jgi:hypothetical protein